MSQFYKKKSGDDAVVVNEIVLLKKTLDILYKSTQIDISKSIEYFCTYAKFNYNKNVRK